jgi:hypothetical protein
MRKIYEKPSGTQRPCFAILRRSVKFADWQSDFAAPVMLEDGRHYHIGVTVRTGRDGEQELHLYLRPLHLYKTPVTPGRLEVVR